MRLVWIGALILLVNAPVFASEDSESRFNDAYREYISAMESADYELAITAARSALEISTQIFDGDDLRLVSLTHNYGTALVYGGHAEQGRDLLEQAIEDRIRLSGKHDPDLVESYTSMAIASAGVGNEKQHLKWYKRALDVASENYGKESVEYANLAYDAGTNLYQLSRSDNGKKYLKQALTIFEREFGASSGAAGMARYQLARIAFYKRDGREVTEYLLEALASFDGDEPDEKAQRLMVHALLVQAYESLGESENATKHCLAIGSESQFALDQEPMPLFRLNPSYPHSQWRNQVEGFVDLTFTIDENGFVKNAKVVEAFNGPPGRRARSNSGFRDPEEHRSFAGAALAALERYRYAPRFQDGKPVAVDDVEMRIKFEIVD